MDDEQPTLWDMSVTFRGTSDDAHAIKSVINSFLDYMGIEKTKRIIPIQLGAMPRQEEA